MLTDKEKVAKYEELFHLIQIQNIAMNNENIHWLVKNICDWSYAHRLGNGELSDEEQEKVIERAFHKLTELPNHPPK